VVAEERNGEVGYRLLETIRQYGQEWLADAGEGALLRERHLQEFLSLAERVEPASTCSVERSVPRASSERSRQRSSQASSS
jgi:predicted ATPase